MKRRNFDRTRTQDATGRQIEIVHPRWWDLLRWFVWLFKTDARLDMMAQDSTGKARLFRLRGRQVKVTIAELAKSKRVCPLCKRPFR